MPELNTSSLPDLVFAFLFFIMMVTTIREVSPKVQYSQLPNATELTKLEEKSLVTYIYLGKPTVSYQAKMARSLLYSLTIRSLWILRLFTRTLSRKKLKL